MFDDFSLNAIVESGSILISVVGYSVVFLSLLLMYGIFANMKRILTLKQRKKLKKQGHRAADVAADELNLSGEVSAAISMAIHLHYAEIHDFEHTVLTIKKVQRTYSPWSSKLYGLRQLPRK